MRDFIAGHEDEGAQQEARRKVEGVLAYEREGKGFRWNPFKRACAPQRYYILSTQENTVFALKLDYWRAARRNYGKFCAFLCRVSISRARKVFHDDRR